MGGVGAILSTKSNFSIIYIRYYQHCMIVNNVCVGGGGGDVCRLFMPLHVRAFCLASTVTLASLLISVRLGNGISIQVSAKLSSFSENNVVLYFYEIVYQDSDYVGVVSRCTAQSMARAETEVKVLPHYITDGEVFSLYESCKFVWITHFL